MTEVYTRFVNDQYQQTYRNRSFLIDHITTFEHDIDEYFETVYSFGFNIFSRFIKDNLSISVNEKTERLATQTALKFIKDSKIITSKKLLKILSVTKAVVDLYNLCFQIFPNLFGMVAILYP